MDQKAFEALQAEMVELKKAVAAKNAPGSTVTEEAIEKRVNALLEARQKAMEQDFAKREDALRKEMGAELRKGRFVNKDDEEDLKSHDVIVEKSDDPKVQNFQKFNDDVYILRHAIRKNWNRHPGQMQYWQKYAGSHSEMKKAMDTATATEGLEWIPTDFSADMIDRVRLARKVSALFPLINMPTDPFKMPSLTSDSTAYLVPEATGEDDTAANRTFKASKPKTGNVTLNAVKLGIRTNFSLELEEDSIIPILEMVKNNFAIEINGGIEDALINGDDSGSHMDADVTDAKDRRKAWKGLRKKTQTALDTQLSTFDTAGLRAMRGKMGKYGVDPKKLCYLLSPKGYVKLLSNADLLTYEKYGDRATLYSGELAQFDGTPVLVSEYVRESLGASGVNDATTNNKSIVLLMYVSAFVMGSKRKITLRSFVDVQNDQTALVLSWRGAFESLYDASTEPIVVKGINLTV